MSGALVPMSTVLPTVSHQIFGIFGADEYRIPARKKIRVSMRTGVQSETKLPELERQHHVFSSLII